MLKYAKVQGLSIVCKWIGFTLICKQCWYQTNKNKNFLNKILFFFKINSVLVVKIFRDDHLCENIIQKISKSYMTCRLGGRSQKEPSWSEWKIRWLQRLFVVSACECVWVAFCLFEKLISSIGQEKEKERKRKRERERHTYGVKSVRMCTYHSGSTNNSVDEFTIESWK